MKKPRLRSQATVPLALDSGAHSIYNKFIALRDTSGTKLGGVSAMVKTDNGHDYLRSKDFRQYVDSYVESLSRVSDKLEFAVSLDIIYNPKASWEIYKEFTDLGLSVLPVYHYGEDIKWLKRYMDSTDHLGISGLGQHITLKDWMPFGDQAWKVVSDYRGRPLVKVHGFALTGFSVISRWPWHSVDSTRSMGSARFGSILLPMQTPDHKGYDYATKPIIVAVSGRRPHDARFVGKQHPDGVINASLKRYLESIGHTIEEAGGSYGKREEINLYFMNRCMKAVSTRHSQRMGQEWKTSFYYSGAPTVSEREFQHILNTLHNAGELERVRYLGTFYPTMRGPIRNFLRKWHGVEI